MAWKIIRGCVGQGCEQPAILELATNFWLLVLSILQNYVKRIIKQASLSHWIAEFNLKVSSAW